MKYGGSASFFSAASDRVSSAFIVCSIVEDCPVCGRTGAGKAKIAAARTAAAKRHRSIVEFCIVSFSGALNAVSRNEGRSFGFSVLMNEALDILALERMRLYSRSGVSRSVRGRTIWQLPVPVKTLTSGGQSAMTRSSQVSYHSQFRRIRS